MGGEEKNLPVTKHEQTSLNWPSVGHVISVFCGSTGSIYSSYKDLSMVSNIDLFKSDRHDSSYIFWVDWYNNSMLATL